MHIKNVCNDNSQYLNNCRNLYLTILLSFFFRPKNSSPDLFSRPGRLSRHTGGIFHLTQHWTISEMHEFFSKNSLAYTVPSALFFKPLVKLSRFAEYNENCYIPKNQLLKKRNEYFWTNLRIFPDCVKCSKKNDSKMFLQLLT